MKKKGFIVLVLLLAVLICDQATAKGQEEVDQKKTGLEGTTLLVGTEAAISQQAWTSQISRFEAETGIKVEAVKYPPGDWPTILSTESATKSGLFDVVFISCAWASQYVAADYLVPLEEFDISEVNPEDIPAFTNQAQIEGKQYSIPYMNEIPGLIYRMDLMEDPAEKEAFMKKYGRPLSIPKTLDEYFEVLDFFTRPPDLYGLVSYGRRAVWLTIPFYPLLRTRGMEVVDYETLRPQINTPEGIMALHELGRMFQYADPASLTAGWFEANSNFQQGRAFSIPTWATVLLHANNPSESKVAGKIAMAPFPLPEGSVPQVRTPLSQWGFSITTTTKNKEAAWAWIKFITSKESHVKAALATGSNVPARYSALRDPEAVKKFSWFPAVADALENALIVPPQVPIPEGTQIHREIVPKYASLMLTGELSPEETAAELEKELLSLLKEGGYLK